MSTVEKTYFEAEDVPTAAELNKVYDDLATASASLDDTNMAAGWATYAHLYDPASNKPFNRLYDYQNDGVIPVDYNNDLTWDVVVDSVGNKCEVDLNYFPNNKEIIRLHMSGLGGEHEVVTDYDFVGADLGKPGYYAFRIVIEYQDSGGGTQELIAGYWGYSFTTNGLNRYDTSPAQSGPSINWQTFQASTLVKYLGTTGVREYKKAKLEVRLFDGANTLQITRHQIQAVRAKR